MSSTSPRVSNTLAILCKFFFCIFSFFGFVRLKYNNWIRSTFLPVHRGVLVCDSEVEIVGKAGELEGVYRVLTVVGPKVKHVAAWVKANTTPMVQATKKDLATAAFSSFLSFFLSCEEWEEKRRERSKAFNFVSFFLFQETHWHQFACPSIHKERSAGLAMSYAQFFLLMRSSHLNDMFSSATSTTTTTSTTPTTTGSWRTPHLLFLKSKRKYIRIVDYWIFVVRRKARTKFSPFQELKNETGFWIGASKVNIRKCCSYLENFLSKKRTWYIAEQPIREVPEEGP